MNSINIIIIDDQTTRRNIPEDSHVQSVSL
jgi:hypothetical protein